VLVKPFEPQQLVSRVKALLDGDQARRSHEGDSGTVTPFPVAARGAVVQASAEATVSDSETRKPMRPARENSAAGPTPVEPREPAVPSKKSLVNAFSALLAGEQTNPPTPALGTPMAAPAGWAAAPSDAALEEAVRRVLGRMTEEQVRRIVVETAERLIREEIEKIKASPE
jgi:hypothetical protein